MFNRLQEGGPIFMYPILFLFIVLVVLFVRALMVSKVRVEMITLLSSVGLLALVWGVLGQVLGLINAFDAVEGHNEVTITILAEALKLTFLPVLFGLVTFLFARIGILILQVKTKK
ncbi:MotA/TolQ/ExbB proton channel family protein [Cochleicola gelatinilyticus]|uniref:Biopolymer transporter ExbD n=1 Tax=Cochleicola gelatinilyticus TaxID=1763537 RepID=A0A167HG57_9FLAO|nr:MotA/TolQ/ExbB proton channel family protein [Cochleicola gelatinilyticus]OAB78572.1 biopolymer transporter ExbD [Cochleicola gelatinilyticus]